MRISLRLPAILVLPLPPVRRPDFACSRSDLRSIPGTDIRVFVAASVMAAALSASGVASAGHRAGRAGPGGTCAPAAGDNRS